MDCFGKANRLLPGAVLLCLCLLPGQATAEPFVDAYFGQAQVADTTVSASIRQVSYLFGGPRFEGSRHTSFGSSNVFMPARPGAPVS